MDSLFSLILVAIVSLRETSEGCSTNRTTDENDRIEISEQKGELSSPGYPDFFKDDIQCTWYIYVKRRHSINLEFEFFDFGDSPSCSDNQEVAHVEVRDGVHLDGKRLGLFCGHATPEKISTTGNEMWVRFKANKYRSVKFKAKYRAIKDSPPLILVITGVSTMVGLMMILLLLTLYLKRKHRNSDEENSLTPDPENQESEQNYKVGAATTSGEHIDLQFSSVMEKTDMRKESLSEQELLTLQCTSCNGNERKQSQSHGTFSRENLTPIAE